MMDLPANTMPIIGAAAAVLCMGYLVVRTARRKKNSTAAQASLVFRNKVLAELEGLYPLPRSWSHDAYNKFRETIPGVESAAAEFRNFVPAEKRGSFDEALKNYCEHCSEITWQSCATFGVIPEMSKPVDVGPKEIFRQNVNALLSFAKES
ncbi:MAG: hypothetical protein AMK71_08730 [Nitrospira bacterium SG8_35_4]|nr:MAG: hypothetical protein AMK71_08730 [Nitrospira bacterium SG8_35_4]